MRNYYEEVRNIMIRFPSTRDDDMLLYAMFCVERGSVGVDETFYNVLTSAKRRAIPSYESVTRARRKVQECEPSLRGERHKARKQEEEEYRDFYGNR